MNEFDACEQAFKNGYDKGKADALKGMHFILDDEQVAIMDKFVEKHNKSRKCEVNKQRKLRNKNREFPPLGGDCQYSLEITFTSFARLASIKCKCGAEEYIGEV